MNIDEKVTVDNLPEVGDKLDYRQVGQLISLCDADKVRAKVTMRGGFTVEMIDRIEPDLSACESDDGDEMCDNCNCWKHTRAMCS